MVSQKVENAPLLSFPPRIKCGVNCGEARSEALALSSDLKWFWMPAFAGMTGFGTFYECVNL
jgi:hypothetical protein